MVDEHWDACLAADLGVTGINAEVMLGQWEFQCFGKGALRAADDLIELAIVSDNVKKAKKVLE